MEEYDPQFPEENENMELQPPGLLKILTNTNFSAMFIGGAISDIGSYFTFIAMMFLALDITAPLGEAVSTQKVALIMVVMMIPSLFLGPFAGAIVDRIDRKKMMYIMDLVGAFASFGLVYVASYSRDINHIYIFAVFSTIVRLFFYPARGASIPKVINNPKGLVQANGLIQIFAQLSRVIGPASAGFIIAATNLSVAFIIDGVSFMVSALLIFSIRTDLRPETEGRVTFNQTLVDLKHGFSIVRYDSVLLFIISFFAITIFAVGAIDPLFTAYLTYTFGLGEQEFGTILSVSAVSGLIGALLVTAKGDIKNKLPFIVSVAFIMGVSLILIGMAPSLPLPIVWLYAGMAVVGLVNVIFAIPVSALMQTIVPNEDLGKVNGLMGTSISLFQVIGAGIASALAGFIAISLIYSTIGVFLLLVGIFFVFVMLSRNLNAIAIRREAEAMEDAVQEEQLAYAEAAY